METLPFDPDILSDAREFVADRLKEQSIGSSIQDEICRLGDGNFLVLKHICRWVREKLLPEDRIGFLKRLAAEPEGPLRAIYDELPRQREKDGCPRSSPARSSRMARGGW
ncbi:MAG: hypothetical protein HYV60_02140, partial [Planctomycetia bacterium]|nr:hypothetical protein [Planctomycetia bacterium]